MLVTTTLVDAVEQQIRHYLRDGNFKPGDPIPTESEFAEQLQVSRTVIREAFSRIRMLGIVEARKRRGMVLAEAPDPFLGLAKLVDAGALGEAGELELFEFRVMLEIGMADFIFHRCTPRDLDELNAIVQKIPVVDGVEVVSAEANTEFHSKLFAITGNRAVARFDAILTTVFAILERRPLGVYRDPCELATHRQLVEILAEGSCDEFRRAIREHLGEYVSEAAICREMDKEREQ